MKTNAFITVLLGAFLFAVPGLTFVEGQIPIKKQKQVKVQIAALPDLEVVDLNMVPFGDVCRLELIIKNAGKGPVPDAAYDSKTGVAVQMYLDAKPWSGQRLFIVDSKRALKKPGGQASFTWVSTNMAFKKGNYQMQAVLDKDNVLKEANERNNRFRKTLNCGSDGPVIIGDIPLKPVITKPLQIAMADLVVSDFTLNHHALQKNGDVFTIPYQAVIRNNGNLQVNDPFYVQVQKFWENPAEWGGTGRGNCFQVNSVIPADGSFTLNGTLILADYELSNQTIRMRVMADFGCNREFPPINGDIAESNEDNNMSDEQTVSGTFAPRAVRVAPETGTLTATYQLIGLNFGSVQGTHAVRLRKGPLTTTAVISNWTSGIIWFELPQGLEPGNYYVSVADRTTLQPFSAEVPVLVTQEKVFLWDDLFLADDLFGLSSSVSVQLHTKSGMCGYNNISVASIFGSTDTLEIPKIQKTTDVGKYRWLVNHFNTREDGVSLNRAPGNADNELAIRLEFESGGTELRGCFSPLGINSFQDAGAPDVEINNGVLTATLVFHFNNGNLDYEVRPAFSADIDPKHAGWEPLMDWAYSEWRSEIMEQVKAGVKQGLEEPGVRQLIAGDLMQLVQLNTGTLGKTIHDIQFSRQGFHLFVY